MLWHKYYFIKKKKKGEGVSVELLGSKGMTRYDIIKASQPASFLEREREGECV
jgi:hypothetical protein